MIEAYVGTPDDGDESPVWFFLDRYRRHMENRYCMLDFQIDGNDSQLERTIRRVRDRYSKAVSLCAERFAKALQNAGFDLEFLPGQDQVFSKYVRGCLTENKTAYFLVDALRYEMGRELLDGLGEGFETKLTVAAARAPTMTEIGMAAPMPGAEKGMEPVKAGTGKVGVVIDGILLKDRASRMKYPESRLEKKPLMIKLDQLMKPPKKLRESIVESDFILVAFREVDRYGEEDEEDARRSMDEVLAKLRRGMRRLASLDVKKIVLAADFGQENRPSYDHRQSKGAVSVRRRQMLLPIRFVPLCEHNCNLVELGPRGRASRTPSRKSARTPFFRPAPPQWPTCSTTWPPTRSACWALGFHRVRRCGRSSEDAQGSGDHSEDLLRIGRLRPRKGSRRGTRLHRHVRQHQPARGGPWCGRPTFSSPCPTSSAKTWPSWTGFTIASPAGKSRKCGWNFLPATTVSWWTTWPKRSGNCESTTARKSPTVVSPSVRI